MSDHEDKLLSLNLNPKTLFNKENGTLEVDRILKDGITIYNLNVEGAIKRSLMELGWTPPEKPAEPELAKGMWVRSRSMYNCYVIEVKGVMAYCLCLDGVCREFDVKELEVTGFTEAYLPLLNTDEVTYELDVDSSGLYHVEKFKLKHGKNIVSAWYSFDTAHEAIASVFTYTAKIKAFDKEHGLEGDNG